MTKPFTSARAVPYSSIVGGGIMLLNEKGACVAQLAIMAGGKEASDAISAELMQRIEAGGKFDRYANIETVVRVNATHHGATEDEIAAFLSGKKEFISWVIRKVEPTAVRDVMVERLRQQTAKGYSAMHDDEHDLFELARAGACYALLAAGYQPEHEIIRKLWPFPEEIKPSATRRRDLVNGASLMIADIERLDRAEGK